MRASFDSKRPRFLSHTLSGVWVQYRACGYDTGRAGTVWGVWPRYGACGWGKIGRSSLRCVGIYGEFRQAHAPRRYQLMMPSMRHRICVLAAAALALCGLLAVAPGDSQPSQGAVQVQVTGGPAPVATLRLAIVTTARTLFPEARNADITLTGTTPPLAELPASSRTAVRAAILISPSGGPAVLHVLPVALTNVILPWSDAQTLLVSNSPETLPFGKVLFNGALTAAQTMRLLYHHQNGSKAQHMFITVALSNPNRTPLTLWVTGAQSDTGAGADELALGHAAARRFLEVYWAHAGFLLRIPANTTLPLFVHDLASLAIGSGLAQLQLVDGDRLNLQVVARLASETEPPTSSFASDFDREHQRGEFTRPQIARALSYTAGGPPAVMALGADADLLDEATTGERLQGNYGVMYSFEVQLANPTPAPAAVALMMHAAGGQARGTFLVGGQIVDGPVVQASAPQVLATVRLAPGTRRRLRIATMPESGSNYPVRLTLGAP